MKRRDFLNSALVGAGSCFLAGAHLLPTSKITIGEETSKEAYQKFKMWRHIPPVMKNGEYVEMQGTLPFRTVLSKALLHSESRPAMRGSWTWTEYYWGAATDKQIYIPSITLNDTYLEVPSAEPVTSKPPVGFDDGVDVIRNQGKELVIPSAHIFCLTRDYFDREWTKITLTMVFPIDYMLERYNSRW